MSFTVQEVSGIGELGENRSQSNSLRMMANA